MIRKKWWILLCVIVIALGAAACTQPVKRYTARFEPNGGVGAVVLQSHEAGEEFLLPQSTLEREGYDFAGWSADGTTYAAGARYVMPKRDVTFTAVWTQRPPASEILSAEDFLFVNGSYRQEGNSLTSATTNALAVHKTLTMQYGSLTVSLDATTAGDNGIVFGLDAGNKTSFWEYGVSYYFFFITANHTAYLGKVDNSWNECSVTPLSQFDPTAPHELRVIRNESVIYGFVDDVLCVSYADPEPLTGTGVGLRAQTVNTCYTSIEVGDELDSGDVGLSQFSARKGSFSVLGDMTVSVTDQMLALGDQPLTDGTVTVRMRPGSTTENGVVFRASENTVYETERGTSYYFFHIGGSYQARLVKVTDGKPTLLIATRLSGINSNTESELKVVLNGNNIKCYLNGQCYANLTDESPLTGSGVGIRAGARNVGFRLFTVSGDTQAEQADVVIFGHSHTQCWDYAEQELASVGRVINMGIGGSIIPQWMPRVDELTSYGAKRYVCWLGSNDIGSGINNTMTIERLERLFAAIRSRIPDAEIYLFTEFYQLESNRTTEEFRAKIRDLNARFYSELENINVVDIFDIVLRDGAVDAALFRDVYHLRADCYGPIAERLLAAMADDPVSGGAATVGAVDYVISEGDHNSWLVTGEGEDAVYTSQADSQLLMLTDTFFTGGTVEFKLKVTSDQWTFSTASGLVFGADHAYVGHGTGTYYCTGQTAWGDLVTFSKNNGAFAWEHENKIPNGHLSVGTEYAVKLVWDKPNGAIHYFLDGEYRMSMHPTTRLDGAYLGFYADNAGVTFRSLRVSDELELDGVDVYYVRGLNTDWTVEDRNGSMRYTATGGKMLMFREDFGSAEQWLVEYDITGLDNTFADWRASGVIIGADKPVIDNRDTFAVVGRDSFGGDLNTYSMRDGIFRWEDSNKLDGYFPSLNTVHHIRFVWNRTLGTITYYNGNTPLNVQRLSIDLNGQYFGLATDYGTVFENLSITPYGV